MRTTPLRNGCNAPLIYFRHGLPRTTRVDTVSCWESGTTVALRGRIVPEEPLILGCLALNASFEPLTMVPMRRALRLVLDGKAEIVESDPGRLVRSERLTLPRPAVIRLMKFIHVPRRFRRQVTNTFLFARDRYRCQYCGRMQVELKTRESLTRDHLIPISRGGTNE